MQATYTPLEAKTLFASEKEFAVLDVREQEEFSRSHILLASCAPLSRLEFMVETLVPCRTVPVVLVDSGAETGPSRAARARDVLSAMGYAGAAVLEGGMEAWKKAGYVDFTGVGALSKGFGEYVEEKLHTPRLEPREIKALMDSGREVAVIDVRPREEYNAMNIPTGLNAPGCEVTYRLADLVPDPETQIIVNCAGRTRSIIGTQTLLNAGIPNPVAALKGGTMNWRLAGLDLEYGSKRRTAPPSAEALDAARRRAAAVAAKYGVSRVDAATVRAWRAEAGRRSLYLCDVRQPEEYLAGHLPGSRNTPGGQLVQATDEYAAVRNARFVLIDDTEVRAVMTAHWLVQMGLPEVHVLRGGLGGSGFGAAGLEYGPTPPPAFEPPLVPMIAPLELKKPLDSPTPPLVLDIGVSRDHRKGHVPGAVWVTRGYLERAREAHPAATDIVVASGSEAQARCAAAEAAVLWPGARVRCLAGGTPAWIAAELPVETDMPAPLCAEDDVWYKPYTDVNARPEAMKGYFDWEFGLVERILKDGSVRFKLVS
ncbi:rhodanese-like domain-containing protein [Solidesulfovibrio sp.]|uniref:rhodanese-like domain-containing protein n=1 Tax=Solidesulfovibrio sp. TaxID=2910990 RepID=UPI00262F4D2F|nr:rhodanese-like domain-containing protein [Solidesulfovibrio sp.]